MVIGIVTTLLKESARTLKDTHAIRQLHCQWRSGSRHAKRPANAALVCQCYTLTTADSLLDDALSLVVDWNWSNKQVS